MLKEKNGKTIPIHLLKKGARFSSPVKGEDLIFEVEYRAYNTIVAKSDNGLKKHFFSDTIVFVDAEEEKIQQYTIFENLPKRVFFKWEDHSYFKLNSEEAIKISPIVREKGELLSLEQDRSEPMGRLPLVAEVEKLPFIPSLARVLTSEEAEELNGQEDIMLWYPVKSFSNKTVVSLDWIPAE